VLGPPPMRRPAGLGRSPPSSYRRPTTVGADRPSPPRRLAADHHQGTAGTVVVVGSVPVVVGSVVVGSVLVVVASVVVVGAFVVGVVVVGAPVVVGPVTGGWVVVAPKAENASVMVVGPAVAGAWALAAPAVVVGRLPANGPVSEVRVDAVGKVVGARGPVVGVDTDLGAGSAGAVGSARAGARRGGDGWGSRVAEATRAARTPVVSPKATSPSLQGHRGVLRCRGGDVRCRGGGVDMVDCPGSTSIQGLRPTP
jgi:hypothetical protein